MTWSAPRERTISTFRVLQTPVTSAPSAFAICTANVPTPPDAPMTRTFCPARSCPQSRSPCSAVAAAFPIAATTALQGLRDWGQLRAGQKVLVIGASGGVGTFAVQIAKALGAEVTGVCSTRNVEMVRSLGADQVIDYTQQDPLLGGKRYDLIFQLAGTASPSRCRRALTPKGTLLLSSGDGRFTGMGRMAAAAVSGPFVSQALVMRVAKLNQADLLARTELIEAGKVAPVIDRTFAFGETPAAVRYCEEGHTRGKVVITVT